jgi:DNA-binding MarR family transcriptional regulator
MPKPKPSSRPPSGAVHFDISRAFYLYINWVDRRLKKTGLDRHLKPGMGLVLFSLFEQDDVIIKQLVEKTQLVASTLTRTLKRMERAKLVERRTDPDDRRAVRIRLTPLGQSLRAPTRQMALDIERIIEDGLSASEVDAVRHGLSRMIQNMQRTRD